MNKKKPKGLAIWLPDKDATEFFGINRTRVSYRMNRRTPNPRDELIELIVTESEWKEFKKWQKLTSSQS